MSLPKSKELCEIITEIDNPLDDTIEGQLTTKGWISYLPKAWVPYLQLMRLDRFCGYYYGWLPHLFGTLLAAKQLEAPMTKLLQTNALIALACIVVRGAAVTWNDLVDIDIDRTNVRCRNRPFARGAVSVTQGYFFILAQIFISLLTTLAFPKTCFLYAVPGIAIHFVYPLSKRWTYFPQLVLGPGMAWGIFVGAAAMGSDPLNLVPLFDALSSPDMEIESILKGVSLIYPAEPSTCAVYAANVIWTILYETIYSHQDAAEDLEAGVKSLVLLYAQKDPVTGEVGFTTLSLLSKLAFAQVVLLAVAGEFGAGGALYFTLAVAGSAAALSTALSRVNLKDPDSCAWWFKVGCSLTTGGAMTLGLLAEYIVKLGLKNHTLVKSI